MPKFKIPVEWKMASHIEVVADTEEEAVQLAYKDKLPYYGAEYIDDSFFVNTDGIEVVEDDKGDRKKEKALLNRFSNPRLSDMIWVGEGDIVYATYSAEQFGFTKGRGYVIQDIQHGYLGLINDAGKKDYYTVEYFTNRRFF